MDNKGCPASLRVVVGTEGYKDVDSDEQVGTAQDESLQVFFSMGRTQQRVGTANAIHPVALGGED